MALRRLDDLAPEPWVRPEEVAQLRVVYEERLRRLTAFSPTDASHEADAALRRLRHEVLTAERLAVVALRDDGVVGDEILQQLEFELDVEALRSGVGARRLRGPDD